MLDMLGVAAGALRRVAIGRCSVNPGTACLTRFVTVALAALLGAALVAGAPAEARKHRQQPVAGHTCGAGLCVGPGYPFATPSQAARRAVDGQTIGIAAGDYEDCALWRASVTIRGIGGRPHIHGKVCHGKALWITRGGRIEIENVEFSGARAGGGNGAAIRHETGTLIVRNVLIRDNEMGILTGHGDEHALEVYDSHFRGQRSDRALAHSIYAGRIGRLVAIGNDLGDGTTGHFIKTLAADSLIQYNRILDARGTEASLIDIWACSRATVAGNVMMRTGTTGNLSFIGLRPLGARDNEVPCPEGRSVQATVAFNTAVFTGPKPLWSALVQNNRARAPWVLVNNLAVNTGSLTVPADGTELGRVEGNVYLARPAPELFRDLEKGDLRPTGPVPGVVASPVVPDREFSAPAGTRPRLAASDAGGFSYAP